MSGWPITSSFPGTATSDRPSFPTATTSSWAIIPTPALMAVIGAWCQRRTSSAEWRFDGGHSTPRARFDHRRERHVVRCNHDQDGRVEGPIAIESHPPRRQVLSLKNRLYAADQTLLVRWLTLRV